MVEGRYIVLGNLIYWLVTNYFCWGMYSKDLRGLGQCYFVAIPFYFTALLKTWVVIRIVETVVKFLRQKYESCKSS